MYKYSRAGEYSKREEVTGTTICHSRVCLSTWIYQPTSLEDFTAFLKVIDRTGEPAHDGEVDLSVVVVVVVEMDRRHSSRSQNALSSKHFSESYQVEKDSCDYRRHEHHSKSSGSRYRIRGPT